MRIAGPKGYRSAYGGAVGFIKLRQQYNPFDFAIKIGEIIIEKGVEEITNHKQELTELHYWATINDKTDCTKINNRLQQYATGDEAWRDSLVQTIG